MPTQSQVQQSNIPPKPLDSRAAYMPCSQEMQRFMAAKSQADSLFLQHPAHLQAAAAAHAHAQQQRLSPTSSVSSLSPISPTQTFVFLPMMNQARQLHSQSSISISPSPEVKSEVWRPW